MKPQAQSESVISKDHTMDEGSVGVLTRKTIEMIDDFRGMGDWVGDWEGKIKITVTVEALE